MAKLELFSLIVCNILANICYSIIVPFLPLEFKRFELDERIYGYIFGVFAAAVMIGSLVVGKLLSTYGRKLILISGLALMGASMLWFGFIEDVENHYLLTVMWLVIRSIQGVSSSMIQTTSYAITAITYPDDQQKYLGFLEASMGVGLLIGPVAGSILYSSLGFKITFFVIGSAFVILTPLLRFVIPRSVDDIDIRDVVGYESSMSLIRSFSIDHGPKTMKYSELFKRKIFWFTSIAAFFAYFQSWYMEPVLALRLTEFGVDNIFLGVFFAFQPITYVICISLKKLNKLSLKINNALLLHLKLKYFMVYWSLWWKALDFYWIIVNRNFSVLCWTITSYN